MAVLINRETGQAFEVADDEAEGAIASMDLVRATPDQVAYLERQRAEAAKPLGQKALETAGTAFAGAAAIGGEIGKAIPESLGGLSDAEAAQADEFVRSEQVQSLREAHPVAFSLGVGVPAFAVSGAVGGIGGMLAESAAVGLSEEAVNRTAEGREFDLGEAAGIAGQDFAFSALAHAATQVAGRVGNLFLFGTGNTMARNVKRGLDETAEPVVPDDLRFEGPLLEAETRSTRAAAAASPGMPPGPERDEMLRRAARDLNQQVESQGGEMFESTAKAARSSAAVGEADAVSRRIDDFLTETTPAQTSWSADATQKLDEMRQAVSAEPEVAGFAARAREAADEAIRAIDSSGDSAAWFKASSRASDRLDALADEIAASDLPEGGAVAQAIDGARGFLDRSLADRALFGAAAEMRAGLRGAARDRIGAAARAAGGDLRAQLAAFVAADASERVAMRAPLEQAIEGFEELAQVHERFGTATPKQIETLRENAATLRRGLSLADDIQGAVSRGANETRATPRAEPAPGSTADADFSRVESLAEQIARRAARKAAQGVVDYASGPGRAVYDDAVSDALKGAIQSAAAIGGLAAFGPVGFAAGWLGARSLGKRYAPEVGKSILEAAQRYVSKHGADTAGLALLGTAALGGDEGDEGSDAAAASVGGLLFARRFAKRALEATGGAARAAGRGVYRASEAVTGAVDAATGKATDALARGTYKAGRAAGETAGKGVDSVLEAFANETRTRRVVGSATRAAMSAAMGPLGWAGREIRHEAGRAMADYFGPRISRRAVEWLERRAGKATAETVQDAVTETAEAARRDPLLLPEHTEQAEAMATDFADQLRRSGAETPEERAAALASFPKRLGGDAHVQRQLLASSVKDLVASLGRVSDPGAAEAAQAFAELANSAIVNARTAQDRFRIGMQLTQTLAEHTARAGDGEMAKVFGAHTEKMWEMMGLREVWMGARELEREAKRQAKKRETLLGRISAGEKLGIAAVGGSAALEDEQDGAAMAGAGALAALLGRRGLGLARHKLTPRSAREILQLGSELPPGGKDVGPGGALGTPGVGASAGARPELRAPVGAGQVEPAPGIPAPAPALDQLPRNRPPIPTDDVFAHPDSLPHRGVIAERLSGPIGVTPGGFFRGDDGVIRYVKVDADPVRARREVGNVAMYNALGVRTPRLEIVELPGGQVATASEFLGGQWREMDRVPDWSTLPQTVRDSYAEQVPVNIILGNWDVSTNPRNVMTDGATTLMVDAGEAVTNGWGKNWFRGNYPHTRTEIELTTRSAHGEQRVHRKAPHAMLESYEPNEGQLRGIVQQSFDRTVATIEEAGGPHAFIRQHLPDLTDQEAKRAGDEMQQRINALKVAIPVLAATVYVAFSGEAQAAEPDERTFAANRIVSIDDAATRRIKHTARVLSGLAEPPSPEGLTTALGRFGAEHDDPRAAFEERKAILQKAELAPALVYDVIGATLGDVARVSPEVYQAAAARVLDGFRYMRENLPPEVKTSLLYPTGLPPSESAMRDWATQWNTVMDPESVLDDIERGTVTHLQIGTLEGAHPDLYQQLRTEVIAEVGANFADIPTATKMRLDILFQADGLAGPMFSSEAAAMIGAAGRAASRRKQPAPVDAGATDAQAASGPSGLEAIRSSVTNRSAA